MKNSFKNQQTLKKKIKKSKETINRRIKLAKFSLLNHLSDTDSEIYFTYLKRKERWLSETQ